MNANSGKHIRIAVGVGMLVIAIGFLIINRNGANKVAPPGPPNIYWSDDDGATFFVAVKDKPSGWDHNGKPAYEASVFTRGSGKPFVGFLRKTTFASGGVPAAPPTKLPPGAPGVPTSPPHMLSGLQTEIKEPGESVWHSMNDLASSKILEKYGPQAQESSDLTLVMP